ncbi:MAG: glycosyltransferase family 39 protein [Candidatus Heimdallarchaeota archaeon]
MKAKRTSNMEVTKVESIHEESFSSYLLRPFNTLLNKEIFKKIFSSLPLVAIIVGSLIVRVIAASESQGFVHPDEVFQAIEMVHFRIFGEFGTGQTIPWEYDLNKPYGGARSWFFVFILVAVYRIAMFFGITNPLSLIFVARLFLASFSIVSVIVAYFFGKEIFNKRIGLLSAFLIGFWWFFPFWSSRTMTDSISTDLIFLSIFLAYKALKNKTTSKKRFLLALSSGIITGLSFMIRFPSALMGIPIILVLWAKPIRELTINFVRRIRNFISKVSKNPREEFLDTKFSANMTKELAIGGGFIIGSFFMVLMQGLLDLFTWGSFLHSPINFFKYNIVEGLSAIHGSSPWYSYFTGFYTDFAYYFLPLLLMFFIFGFSHKRKVKTKIMIFSIIIFWIVVFSFLAHKEFRFVMTILPLCMIMVAAGIERVVTTLQSKRNQHILLSFILIFLGSTSLFLANYNFKYMWKWNSGVCNAMYWVGEQDDVETVIVFETVWYTGGYAYLDVNVTCYFLKINYIFLPLIPVYNSSFFRYLYSQKGTYAIVRDYELSVMEPILTELNMTIVANVYGSPYAKVFTQAR